MWETLFFFLVFSLMRESSELPQVSVSTISRCTVLEQNSSTKKSCFFPFTLNKKTYLGCSDVQDPDNKAWCSTLVDSDGVHVPRSGRWGHCPSDCPIDLIGIPESQFAIIRTSLLDILAGGSRSISLESSFQLKSSLAGSSCPCTDESQCEWLSKIKTAENQTPRGHPLKSKLSSLRSSARCGSSRVRCCDGQSQSDIKFNSGENSGTWKPQENKGECGISLSNENVVGGDDAKAGDFPFAVLLGYESKGRLFYACGGSLINKRYVLTAAHCVEGTAPKQVVLGEHILEQRFDCINEICLPEPQIIDVESTKLHENYKPRNPNNGYDIGLVRLRQLAVLSYDNPDISFVSPVCLPWRQNDPGRNLNSNSKLVTIGWGRTTNDKQAAQLNLQVFAAGSRILQKLENISYIPGNDCRNPKNGFSQLNTDLVICAGAEKGKDSCSGDSGGPLLFRKNQLADDPWYQVGIVSFGTEQCGVGIPGVYTDVTKFIDWISKNLAP